MKYIHGVTLLLALVGMQVAFLVGVDLVSVPLRRFIIVIAVAVALIVAWSVRATPRQSGSVQNLRRGFV